MYKYILDTNIFIKMKNDMFPIAQFPEVWVEMLRRFDCGVLYSIDTVYNELQCYADELNTWTQTNRKIFTKFESECFGAMKALTEWAMSSNFKDDAKQKFLSDADSTVIAYAMTHNMTVVTQEKPSLSLKKIMMPNACKQMRVECINLFDLLKQWDVRVVFPSATQS